MSISVIIPVFNAACYIENALQSIYQQTLKPLEIIVVDDGSTDELKSVLEKHGPSIQYLYQENQGPASARNAGIQRAKGDFIAFLDADDVWQEKTQEILYNELSKNLKLDGCWGKIQVQILKENTFIDSHTPQKAPSFACALFRKEAFEKAGLLNPEYRQSEDVEWFLRAKNKGLNFHFIEESLLYYRLHKTNITKNVKENQFYLMRALKSSMNSNKV